MDDYEVELLKALAELEDQLADLQTEYGDDLNKMRDVNGNSLAAPLLVGRVQGYAALIYLGAKKRGDRL